MKCICCGIHYKESEMFIENKDICLNCINDDIRDAMIQQGLATSTPVCENYDSAYCKYYDVLMRDNSKCNENCEGYTEK